MTTCLSISVLVTMWKLKCITNDQNLTSSVTSTIFLFGGFTGNVALIALKKNLSHSVKIS